MKPHTLTDSEKLDLILQTVYPLVEKTAKEEDKKKQDAELRARLRMDLLNTKKR